MMVTRWGFSDELGTVAYGENQDEVFLGMSVSRQQNVSEATAQKIDAEVRRLIEDGLYRGAPDPDEQARRSRRVAKGLLEYETLSGDEIKDLIVGKPPVRDTTDEPPRSSSPWCPRRQGSPAPGAGWRHGAPAAGLSQSG